MDILNSFEVDFSVYTPVYKDEFGGSYLGTELHNARLSDEDLSHEYFNGAKLYKCLFHNKAVKHTWFKESHLNQCIFERCQLNSSDLVFSVFENCRFIDCDFSNGEWLESKFDNCIFQRSRFHSTTLNLSRFKNCFFDADSFAGLNEQSVQYNIFESCSFGSNTEVCKSFLCRNFGLTNIPGVSITPIDSDGFSKLSEAMATGTLSASDFVKFFKEILSGLIDVAGGAHQLRSKYLSMICTSYIAQGMLSIAGIIIVENTLTDSLSWLRPSQFELFNELTGLLFSLRIESCKRIEELEKLLDKQFGQELKISSGLLILDETYNKIQIQPYMEQLCDFCQLPYHGVEYQVRAGSTEIPFSFLSELVVSATGVFGFIAVTLKSLKILTGDAKQILVNTREIKEEVKKWRRNESSSESNTLSSTNSETLQHSESLTVVRILSGQQRTELGEDVTQLVIKNGESLLKVDSPGILHVEVQ